MNTSKKSNDPHAVREASKYENPIASREFIMALFNDESLLLSSKQIAETLEYDDEDRLEALRRRLIAMERDGQLICNRRGKYGLLSKMALLKGRVIGHPDGFGFLTPDDGGDDLFLSGRQMQSLLHGDTAVVRVAGQDRRGRREGAVVEVLERAIRQVVGRFHEKDDVTYVVPDDKRLNQDFMIPASHQGQAKKGDIVVAEIVAYPTRYARTVARVSEVIGKHMAPGMEIEIAVRNYDLPDSFPETVEKELSGLSEEVPSSAWSGRKDIRDLSLVTIDGEDARDFDDAVYCEKTAEGWRLLVAIADVSSYVKAGTALDEEAFKRGNSVYFPGNVIPMLPEVLSNGLCSINPDVNRLCMVCELEINHQAEVLSSRFFDAVMRSHARLTYTKVAAIVVDGDEALTAEYKAVLPTLKELHSLYKVLLTGREKRGAIDFETTETQIVFGDDRKIERITPLVRNDAHKMIEEFMILANVAAARFLGENNIPIPYRIHKGPTTEKLQGLREFLGELGLKLGGGDTPTAADYGALLKKSRERPDAHLIQTVLLRSMSQALYTPDNIGHFGLGFDDYAHFTSPIRRYPDLLVHRAIRHVLSGKAAETFTYSHNDMVSLGEHCSSTERRADEATRDVESWLKCEYIEDKIGEVFDSIITSVTGFGFFAELNEIYVDGLVHITSLGDEYFVFDPAKQRLTGEHSNKTYRLGDKVRVRIAKVNLDERKIDFELEDGVERKPKPKPKRRRTKRK